jgi:hypothetical protein
MILVNSFAFGSPSNLLLTFSGANNSNVFVDSSSFNHTITTVGTPIQFNGLGVFDGNGYIYTDTLPLFLAKDFTITGAFSISGWPSGFQNPAVFGYTNGTSASHLGILVGGAAGVLGYKKLILMTRDEIGSTQYIVHQDDITLNVVHTFKAERLNGFVRLFIDDIEASSSYAIGSTPLTNNSSRFCIGGGEALYELFVGTVDELNVVVKG